MTERPAKAPSGERGAVGPQRTCVGCRGTDDRSTLLRLVVDELDGAPALVLDHGRRLPGRGLWLHPDGHCLDLARRRSAFARALRRRAPVDTSRVLDQLGQVLHTGTGPHGPDPHLGAVPGAEKTDRRQAER